MLEIVPINIRKTMKLNILNNISLGLLRASSIIIHIIKVIIIAKNRIVNIIARFIFLDQLP